MATASCHAGAYANRLVIVVDDIDPTDTNQVLWALCTRTMTTTTARSSTLLPEPPLKTLPAVVRTSPEEAERLRARYPGLFGPDVRVRREPTSVRPLDS